MDKSWKVIFAFVGIFVAGTITGVLIAPRLFQQMIERRWPSGPGGPRGGGIGQQGPQFGPQLFRRIAEQLNLTAEQREKFEPIETRTVEDFRKLRRETQHNTELIIERTQAEIAAILTPEQRTKLDDLMARGRERIQKMIQQEQERNRGRRDGQPGGPQRTREGMPREGATPK